MDWIECRHTSPCDGIFAAYLSWHLALLIGAVELVDVLNEVIHRLLPLFDDEDTPSNYREFVASQKKGSKAFFLSMMTSTPVINPYFLFTGQ